MFCLMFHNMVTYVYIIAPSVEYVCIYIYNIWNRLKLYVWSVCVSVFSVCNSFRSGLQDVQETFWVASLGCHARLQTAGTTSEHREKTRQSMRIISNLLRDYLNFSIDILRWYDDVWWSMMISFNTCFQDASHMAWTWFKDVQNCLSLDNMF